MNNVDRAVNIKPSIVMVGCFDTKAEDFHYLYTCLQYYNLPIITVNLGILGSTDLFPVHISNRDVAEAAGEKLDNLVDGADRQYGLEVMGRGSRLVLKQMSDEGKVLAVIGMGGGGGTYVALNAMLSIPFGIPKLCISTLASKDLSNIIGGKDIVLMPSIVDVAGLNQISKQVMLHGAGAVVGMVNAPDLPLPSNKGNIAISVFGNTTLCVNHCSALLRALDYDVYTFHAVGVGGKTMESLILDGFFDAVLDITTTELVDELCGGICSAGPDRLTAAATMGLPQVVVPGCMDMVNFGPMETVPEPYANRQLFSWAPDVTLMRTNKEENQIIGQSMARKINQSMAPVVVLLPSEGLSIVSGPGQPFYQPMVDRVLFDTLKQNLNSTVSVLEIPMNVNTVEFANLAVEELLKIM
ncbi:Tm-1-like ATP-binding domain-containing protein [Membranihabitans marinus]|uniref:Tm-1-like ATP-binding domain-containing protein n=1 Tax=Membranihabitans marinus TaxID=1227546 RepID=UPI001F2547E7|nr:Tm-1-like ATP-binding domain-containing protein [Membranihabitans marinus]